MNIKTKANKKLIIHIFLITFTVVVFVGCDSTIENIIECIENINPSLPNKELKEGMIGVTYQDEIIASVNGQARNSNYHHDFSVYGLPSGLTYNVAIGTLLLEGVPTEKGSFTIKIHLSVYSLNDLLFNCAENTSKEYTLNIN